MGNTGVEMTNAKTEEEALQILNKNYENIGDGNPNVDFFARNWLLANGRYGENQDYLQYLHSKQADVGKALHNDSGSTWNGFSDTYTRFDDKTGKYVDEKNTKDWLEFTRQLSHMPGMNEAGSPVFGIQ